MGDSPQLEWQEHMGNWTALFEQRLVANVVHYQDLWHGWYWCLLVVQTPTGRRYDSAEEAKEAAADLLGDELVGNVANP